MLVYHYTTLDTFFKILESKAIWASDLSKMNDPQEFIMGIELIREIFQDKSPELLDWFDRNQMFGLDAERLLLGCSFSEKTDDLSQWRAYGDDGQGVVIGIDKSVLHSNNTFTIPSFEPENERTASFVHFHKVIYSKKKFQNSVKELLNNSGDFINDRLEDFKLSIAISRLACSFKSDFYQNEQEIKAIIEYSKNPSLYLEEDYIKNQSFKLKFRVSQFGLVPYCRVNLGDTDASSIKTVNLGPKCNISQRDLEFMLLATGYKDVVVTNSDGKYR